MLCLATPKRLREWILEDGLAQSTGQHTSRVCSGGTVCSATRVLSLIRNGFVEVDSTWCRLSHPSKGSRCFYGGSFSCNVLLRRLSGDGYQSVKEGKDS